MTELKQQLQQQLQQTGDFLSMTRKYEFSLPTFSFEVSYQRELEVGDNCLVNKSKVTVVDTGIILFEPLSNTSKKDIVLSCAVHGNETAPIEICSDLIKQLILGDLFLSERVMFIFGNPAAINIGKRFVEENLNRLFSGGHSADQGQGGGLINKERHRALFLENTVRDFYLKGSQNDDNRQRFHYDLHTAIRGSKNGKFAVYPFMHGQPRKKEQLQFLLSCEINTVLLSHSPTTTFSYFSSNEFGADAFTVELGKVEAFGDNDMNNFVAVQQVLGYFISGQNISYKKYDEADFNIFEIHQVINRNDENFKFHFNDDVENFTDFQLNTVLVTDGDNQYLTEKEGEAIIFPNADVAIGQRALLTVIPTKIV